MVCGGLTCPAQVMLFMKGDPANAKCKFSKQVSCCDINCSLPAKHAEPVRLASQVVALLAEEGIAYDSFDILKDEEALLPRPSV